VLAQRRASPAA